MRETFSETNCIQKKNNQPTRKITSQKKETNKKRVFHFRLLLLLNK